MYIVYESFKFCVVYYVVVVFVDVLYYELVIVQGNFFIVEFYQDRVKFFVGNEVIFV